MATIIVANHKGGTGKTTTAYWLARHLKDSGHKPLCIDLDPQGSLTRLCGGIINHNNGIGDVLMGRTGLNAAAQRTVDGLQLIGTDIKLAEVAAALQARSPNHNALARAIRKEGHFFAGPIIIDCAPSADILTVNALCAADYLITPLDPCPEALAGMKRMLAMAEEIADGLGKGPKPLGLVITRFNAHTIGHRTGLEAINATRGNPPVLGVIPLRMGQDAKEKIAEAYVTVAEKVAEVLHVDA